MNLPEIKTQYRQEAIDQGLLSAPAAAVTTATTSISNTKYRDLFLIDMVQITDEELSLRFPLQYFSDYVIRYYNIDDMMDFSSWHFV
jgi:hypothetical protein